MTAKRIDLTAPATQSGFGEIVGVSQQAIADRVKSGVLPREGTYGEWLYLYCEQLRKEAAGRSGEAQEQLTQARIEESRENAAEKKQRRLLQARQLILVSDIVHTVLDLAGTMRTQVTQAADKIHETIQDKYKLQLSDDDIHEPLRAALRHVADRAGELQRSAEAGPDGTDTAEGGSDF